MVRKAVQAKPNLLLKAARQERGWTQQDVADRIGAPLALNVSRWETGVTSPSAYYIERLCYLFGKSIYDLGLSHFADGPRKEDNVSNTTTLAQISQRIDLLSLRSQALPLPITPLVGRQEEVRTVCGLLRRPELRLVTLTGTGGIGKTRLALQVVKELRDLYADGVGFISLASLGDPALVFPTIAQTLGLTETDRRSLPDLMEDALREKQMLLLLDNFERLIPAAPQIVDLLARCPQLTILVTSRAVLHVQGEYEFPVCPLSLPDQDAVIDCETLTRYAAVILFVERAQAVRPDFRLTPTNASIIAEICWRLDGLPLALELAAARLKLLSPRELLTRLSARLEILTGGPQDLPERQQTLRKTIQWSYQLLDAQEQRLFQRLSVFVGGCTLEAAEVVCAAEAAYGSGEFLLDGIASLNDKSLLQTIQQEGEASRLSMLETIREYGLECLETSGELEAIGRAHALYYLDLAREAEFRLTLAKQVEWMERLGREYANLRAALQWCLDHEEHVLAVNMATSLADFWLLHGPVSEGHAFLKRALARSEGLSTLEHARARAAEGWLECARGDFDEAERWCAQSLALFYQLGELHGIALMLYRLGYIRMFKGDSTGAQQLLKEGLARFRDLGDILGMGDALHTLGNVLLAQGNFAQARSHLEESLTLYRQVNAPSGVANALYLLGSTTFQQGDLHLAQSLFEGSLALFKAIHHKQGIALALVGQGLVALVQAEYVKAQALLEEGVTIARLGGWQEQIVWGVYGLGWVAFNLRDYNTARSYFEDGLALCREVGNQIIIAFHLEGLATAVLAQGQATWAAQLWGAAERVRKVTNFPIPPVLNRINEQLILHLKAQLGEEALTAIASQAHLLTLDEVLRQGEPAVISHVRTDWSLSSNEPRGQAAPFPG